MFKSWMKGETFVAISKRFKLSAGQVSNICHYIDVWSERGKPEYKSVKHLTRVTTKARQRNPARQSKRTS